MRKHIIVEGPDGCGKDTLISSLLAGNREFSLHPRFSTSLGGPIDGLYTAVGEDIMRMSTLPPQIYNRHPLISEPIYWRARRDPGPILTPDVVMEWAPDVAKHCVLVICQPPFHTALEIVRRQGKEAHMPGVFENYVNIYNAYSRLVWPGATIRYDWTKDTVPSLIANLRRLL